jgi:hypothetical protein
MIVNGIFSAIIATNPDNLGIPYPKIVQAWIAIFQGGIGVALGFLRPVKD